MDRIIFHVDVNSAFLSWSAVYRIRELGETDDLRTVPSIVGGDEMSRRGIVLAKSVPAASYGIKTAEPVASARRKCPGLIVVPSDYRTYKRYSDQFISLLGKYSDNIIQYSIDEAWVVFDGYESMYGDMVKFAYSLKDEIKETLGFTVNIGVSTQFILAKMAGDFSKPDKVHTLFPDEVKTKMWPLPVSDMLYAGKSMTKAMRNLGIITIEDLAKSDRSVIEGNLGKFGVALWEYANGADIDPTGYDEGIQKGYGHSTTTAVNVEDYETAEKVIDSLCDSVCRRLREDKVVGGCVSVSVRYSDFSHVSRQMTIDRSTADAVEIRKKSMELLRCVWDGRRPIRQLGVRVSKIDRDEYHQMSLFEDYKGGYLYSDSKAEVAYEKKAKAEAAMDALRKKMGKDIVKRGNQL
ncbi:MAG: DNA polymerase IV [Lachnospiraceae bacterium]|nr:DNA polymerase IV [Lachnospiraceae bacterium]